MATVDELIARRDALIQRREAAVSRVKTGDKEVQYDLNQIRSAILELDKQIAVAGVAAGRRPVRQIRFIPSRGL
jgi:hypothetical protein